MNDAHNDTNDRDRVQRHNCGTRGTKADAYCGYHRSYHRMDLQKNMFQHGPDIIRQI